MTDCSLSSEGGSLQLPVPFKRHVLGEVGKAGEAPGDCRDRSQLLSNQRSSHPLITSEKKQTNVALPWCSTVPVGGVFLQ